MNILITGGTGYIGSHIALDLAAGGHQITVLGRGERGDRMPALRAAGVEMLKADLATPGDLLQRATRRDYQVIIHGVCSFLEPTRAESLTTRAMHEALAFAQTCPHLAQFIDLGNCLVLKEASPGDVPDEEYPCLPDTRHGHNKLQAERALQSSGLPWVILRVGQVYGGKGSSFDWVILDGVRKGSLPLPCAGNNRYGLVHVEDVAQATRLVIEQGHTGLILNVCSADTQVTQGQIFDLVADGFGVKRAQRIPRPAAMAYAWVSERLALLQNKEPQFVPDMVRVLSGDRPMAIDKARRVLGYEPQYPQTLEGIRKAYAAVFSGQEELFTPAGRMAEVRGLNAVKD